MVGLNAITTFVTPVLGTEGGAWENNPIGHTLDSELIGSGMFAFTMQTGTLILAFVILMVLMNIVAKRIETGPESDGNERYVTKGRLAQIVEVIVIMLRDMFIKPQLGENTNKYLPMLLTLFFFILVNNLIGLVPLLDIQHLASTLLGGSPHWAWIGGTPTGRIGVNAALALVVFLVWNVHGIIENGVGGWLKHFLGGAPLYLAPIMIPVEIIGTIVKPVALTIRLFANMTAGHVLLAAIIGFAPLAVQELGWFVGSGVGLISFVAGIVITFLELFVAFLQAFVFMFLAAVFIAQMSHHEHDEHAHEHGEGEAIPDGAALGAA